MKLKFSLVLEVTNFCLFRTRLNLVYLPQLFKSMEKLIAAFPENITEALTIARSVQLQPTSRPIHHVVVCGMGGSGIGGKIVAQWLQDECPVPILSCQDYELPAFVGENTLVIGSSYSGNTEETLHALGAAHARGALIVGIASGGELKQFCLENNYDVITVPGGNPPRTALAFSLVQLLAIFQQLDLVKSNYLAQMESGAALLIAEKETILEEANRVTDHLKNKVIVTYAGAEYEAVTIRAKQQINENSKELCWQHVIPEMNHNELVGWGGGDQRYAAWFLQTGDLSARNQKRFEISMDIVKKHTDQVVLTYAKGSGKIERSLYLIHLIDWVSLFLSNRKNGDPIEINNIDFLKDALSKM